MQRFSEYQNKQPINEGGNLSLGNVQAEKIDMTKSTRAEFVKLTNNLFYNINKRFEKKYKQKLWVDESKFRSGELYNGSTSFIFSPDYSDEEIMKHKTKSGDVDVIIPKEKAQDLWNLLKPLEGKEIISGVEYIGNNRQNDSKLGDQINSIFKMTFSNGYKVLAQIDFEMLSVDDSGTPNEFSKFAHSSTYEDLTIGQKGVSQKYLMISLGGAISLHKNVMVVTPSSTEDKYKIKLKGGQPISKVTTVKFSVDRGLRGGAFEKQNWEIDGKSVYKEVPTSQSTYIQDLEAIFEIFFGKVPTSAETKKMWSFKGLNELMKKYLSKKQIKLTYERMLQRTWEKGAQGLEVELGDGKGKELDYMIKDNMNGYMEKVHGLKRPKNLVDTYYKNYR